MPQRDGRVNLLRSILRRARAMGRRLTPPGSRVPIDEGGEQHSIDPNHTVSEAGQRQQSYDSGLGGV